MKSLLLGALALAASIGAGQAQATTILDPVGDYVPGFVGPQLGDLDVLSFSVGIDGSDFLLNATMNGAIGTTAGGIFVFGVDRGGGGAGFAANGLPGVLFNSVVVLNPDGTGLVNLIPGATGLAPGAVTISGATISGRIPIALLPSTGFAPERYGFNLWPRLAEGTFTSIADFAPDNATISPIPEPASWALLITGFGILGAALRARRPVVVRLASRPA